MSFITKLFRKEKALPPSELHGAMSAEQSRVEHEGQASVRKHMEEEMAADRERRAAKDAEGESST